MICYQRRRIKKYCRPKIRLLVQKTQQVLDALNQFSRDRPSIVLWRCDKPIIAQPEQNVKAGRVCVSETSTLIYSITTGQYNKVQT